MGSMVVLNVPQDVLDSARLTAAQLKIELAASLYAQRRLSVGKARELAGLSLWDFRRLLAARQIPVHYDLDDLQEDMIVVQELTKQ